ncbi:MULTISPECIES: DUF2780 domain-containing protein [Vibrio]|uniref:DUF2780 domain-containing protein n=1 Tax=Vibrio TaxID=662 RepID=UPI00057066EE|nr:DUF2780 domain-containing protein [Vibrio pacinii]
MNKRILLGSCLTLALLGCQSTGTQGDTTQASNTNYNQLATAALTGALQVWGQQSGAASTDLASTVQQASGVTSEQAVGGIGSMLALAQSSLGSSQSSELANLIPGYELLESSGLSSMITNSGAVDSAFAALGMDPAMVSTFAPLIINALQSQGASSALMQGLSSIWQ